MNRRKSYHNLTKSLEEKGFIDKNYILTQTSQEEIFEFVFGFEPVEFEYVCSPFREDNNPGCWFEYTYEGKLKFKDFGSWTYVGKRKMRNIDCFDAVQIYFQLPNLYKTLRFIQKHIIQNKKGLSSHVYKKTQKKPRVLLPKKKDVKILVRTRDFGNRDRLFWSKFEISKANLIQDRVFPISSYKVLNSKNGDYLVTPPDATYCFTKFKSGKKKVYRPYHKGKYRFVTTCSNNDIGALDALVPFGRQLVISKSYKDCRVLRNQGLNSVWFQNEGMFPDDDILFPLCQRFQKVVIFYDNDRQGIESSTSISNKINSKFPYKSQPLYLPEMLNSMGISDPADMVHKRDVETLNHFLFEKKLK